MSLSFEFDFVIAFILALCVISQGIFGVGVLLWGTPALLLMGMDYFDALGILLPISIFLSTLQLLPNLGVLKSRNIYNFYTKCLPALLCGLATIIFMEVDVSIFVLLALFISGILRLPVTQKSAQFLQSYSVVLLPIIGFVHGVSNLGGSILLFWATLEENKKLQIRTLIAFCYVNLAISQLGVFYLSGHTQNISIPYIILSAVFYIAVSQRIFQRINNEIFQNLITILIFLMIIMFSIKLFK